MLSGARTPSLGPSSGDHALGVIPARLGSSRLPRKPLIPLAGRPLIEWVWRRLCACDVLGQLVVATDAAEVVETVQRFGGRAVMTRADHRSGTDRVAEVAALPEFAGYRWVVNVQGDEPFLPPGAESAVVQLVRAGWNVGTVAVPVTSMTEFEDPAVVKVVLDDEGGALYFSRAPIPYAPGGGRSNRALEKPPPLRHVGVYAFSRDALLRATRLPSHPLEEREGLEQLRWLAAGLRIGVSIVTGGAPGVDTEDDVARAIAILGGRDEAT